MGTTRRKRGKTDRWNGTCTYTGTVTAKPAERGRSMETGKGVCTRILGGAKIVMQPVEPGVPRKGIKFLRGPNSVLRGMVLCEVGAVSLERDR